jgi:hypothetical protein
LGERSLNPDHLNLTTHHCPVLSLADSPNTASSHFSSAFAIVDSCMLDVPS